MKKLFLLFAFVGISLLGYGQDVKVNINNQDATAKDDCPYRINGICSTEDIGGVEVDMGVDSLIFTNYNNSPVTVLWNIEYNLNLGQCPWVEKTGNLVLGVEEQKKVPIKMCKYGTWSLKGLIVRKLAQQ